MEIEKYASRKWRTAELIYSIKRVEASELAEIDTEAAKIHFEWRECLFAESCVRDEHSLLNSEVVIF